MKKSPTIHFVYTVPFSKCFLRRCVDKMIKLLHLTPLHRMGSDFFIPWAKPIRAPHSISYHLLRELKKKYPVRFYSLYEHLSPKLSKGDIFLGQPLPAGGFNESRPVDDDHTSVTSVGIRKNPGGNNFLILPYTHDPLYVSWLKNLLMDHTGGVIFIAGQIWERNWNLSPFADIPISRKLHVNMAISPTDYPVVKKNFNLKGKRKYLYIGHTAWYKNTKELERIAEKMPEYEFAHIGEGEVKGWKKISSFVGLTPEFMTKIALEYDIFVNTSTGDPQATTILEQMCFGIVVACTPESGYDYESLVRLNTNDTEFNVNVLKDLQNKEEVDLIEIAKRNRQNAEKYHSWDTFTKKIIDFIEI